MNTKTDGMSSGLVAVAWIAPSNYEWPSHFISLTEIRNGQPLVRLSDAEAIISDLQTLVIAENQRKQQLEAEVMWLKAAQPNIVLIADKDAVISQQSKRIEELTDGLEESDAIRDRCAHLLAETAVALKGPEKALHRHGWQDLPEVAAKQSAALKLAKDALQTPGQYYAWLNFGECRTYGKLVPIVDMRLAYLICKEALAAIDALGE